MPGFLRLAAMIAAFVVPAFAAGPAMANESDGSAATLRIVRSLIEFTRWPRHDATVDLCLIGPANYAARLDGAAISGGRTLKRRTVGTQASAVAGCDVLYLGRIAPAAARDWIAAARGNGVMTVAEADPDCRSGAMFCLIYPASGVSFRLNIDAVSRSGLRVDPRVLRVSREAP